MLATAMDIAREAGDLALEMRASTTRTDKQDGTWVTEADRAAEDLIRSRLAGAFPHHEIYGEEAGGAGDLGGHHCWLVDPIDGTTNYVTGLPIWGVSLGLLCRGAPTVGVFYMPVTGDLFAAEAGAGARLNDLPISPDARGVVDHNSLIAMNSDAIVSLRVDSPAIIRNLGSTAAHGCYVASAAVTAVIFDRWRTWDIAGALCIALEAGATASYLDGSPLTSFAKLPPDVHGDLIIIAPEFAAETLRPRVSRNPTAPAPITPPASER